MVARQMNPAASILLAKFGLPLGALGSLAAQRSIRDEGEGRLFLSLRSLSSFVSLHRYKTIENKGSSGESVGSTPRPRRQVVLRQSFSHYVGRSFFNAQIGATT